MKAKTAILLPLLGCLSCESGPRTQDLYGFRFPESEAKVLTEILKDSLLGAELLHVSAGPSLRMGAESDSIRFKDLRSVLRLKDGRFIGADGDRQELLVFDSAGVFLEVWGRDNEGSAIFEHPEWIGLCAHDQVYVYDIDLGKLGVFNLDGSVIGIDAVFTPPNNDRPAKLACNARGSLAAISWREVIPSLPVGPHRESVTVAVGDLNNGFNEIARVAGRDRYRYDTGDGPMHVWGRYPTLAVLDDRIYVATGDVYEIAVYRLDGEMEALLRASRVDRLPVTIEEILAERDREAVERRLSARRRRGLFKLYESMVFPAFHPAIKGLIADGSCIWIMDGHPVAPYQRWRVLNQDAQPIGVVDVPHTFDVLQVTFTLLVGRERVAGAAYMAAYNYARPSNDSCSY